MILRRIAKGIKEQDWFVVSVEVAIVVVGIFIGLQVDDWNEGRKNQSLEAYYLDTLERDIQTSINEVTDSLEDSKTHMQNLIAFKNALDHRDLDSLTDDITAYIKTAELFPNLRVNTSTLRQLTEGDGIKLLQSKELRERILSMATEISFELSVFNVVIEDGYIKFQVLRNAFDEKLTYEPSAEISWNHTDIKIISTPEDLYDDPEALQAIRDYIRAQSYALLFVNRVRDLLVNAIEDIKALRSEGS